MPSTHARTRDHGSGDFRPPRPAERPSAASAPDPVTGRIAGAALAAAPLALLIGNLIGVDASGDDSRRIAALPAGTGREQVKILLFLLAATLLLVGVAGIRPLLARRGAVLGRVGTVLAVPGLVAFAGLVTTWLYDVALTRALPPARAAQVFDAASATAAAPVILVVGLVAMPLGILLLVTGLWRAGATPWWTPSLVFAGFVVVSVVDNRLGGMAGNLLLFAGLGMAGRCLARAGR